MNKNKKTEEILRYMTDRSNERDIIKSDIFKLLKHRMMLDPYNNSSIVIGRLPKAFKDEGYKVLDCNFDEVLDSWVTIVDMHDKFPEEWRPVKGYEGLYEVSNWGRVRSINYNKTGITKERCPTNVHGYKHIQLWKNNKVHNYRIHRLVAEAFIPNPDNLPYINHKDENKHNNRSDNLEWCTAKYNSNYGTIKKRISKTKIKQNKRK